MPAEEVFVVAGNIWTACWSLGTMHGSCRAPLKATTAPLIVQPKGLLPTPTAGHSSRPTLSAAAVPTHQTSVPSKRCQNCCSPTCPPIQPFTASSECARWLVVPCHQDPRPLCIPSSSQCQFVTGIPTHLLGRLVVTVGANVSPHRVHVYLLLLLPTPPSHVLSSVPCASCMC